MSFQDGTLVQGRVKGIQETGSACQNVFQWFLYFDNPAGAVPEDDVRDEIVDLLYDLFYSIRDWLPGATKWLEVDLEYQAPASSVWVDWTTVPLNYNGNDTADDLPGGVSAVLTGKTSSKKRRARKFLPAISERGSDQQSWTAGALLALAGAAIEWLTGRQIPGYDVWLYPIAFNQLSRAWTALTAVIANAIPGYQRRRKPGVGI